MMNQMMVVGRIVDNPKLEKTDNGRKVMNMTIAVPRTYKNSDGSHETDFVDCVLWNNVAENTAEYCKKGDLVGVQGSVQTDLYDKDGQTHKSTKIHVDKVSFLAPRNRMDEIEKDQAKKSKTKGAEK